MLKKEYNSLRRKMNVIGAKALTVEDFVSMDTRQKASTLKKLMEISGIKEQNLRDFGVLRKSYAYQNLKKTRKIKDIKDIAKLTGNQMTREATILLKFMDSKSSTPYGIQQQEKEIEKQLGASGNYSKMSASQQKRFWNLVEQLKESGVMSFVYGTLGSADQQRITYEFMTKVKSFTTYDWRSLTNEQLEDLLRDTMDMPMSDGQRALRQARKATGVNRKSAIRAMGFTGKGIRRR